MRVFHIDLSSTRLRFCCAFMVFILPLLVGGWITHNNYMQELESDSAAAARKALMLMDTMMAHAEHANGEVLPLVGAPCDKIAFKLREQVALVPFVRSVNLVNEGVIYCTSLFGLVREDDDVSQYVSRKLFLMSGNRVRANHPLLIVRSERGKDAALSAIDGEYLRIMLALTQHSGELFMRVGSAWFDETGRYLNKAPDLSGLAHTEIGSLHYPFSIHAGYVMPAYWRLLWDHKYLTLSLLGGLSLLFSLLVWWLLGRPGSPAGELRRALRAREFEPYLQPLVRSGDNQLMGVEVLMRWNHPHSGLIRPDLFIPQAEESGLIVPMTILIMKRVARVLSREQARLPDGFHINVNISAAVCHDPTLLEECGNFLAEFDPGKIVLVLELTERELLVADPQTLSLFRQLDQMGVKLAIDDFGTGHSSLLYLQQFHVDYLKIDQSFIGRIGTESLSEHIVANVIDLGARLGLSLVAEGVETEQQAAYLRAKGVDYLQGYLFGRPMPLRQFCDGLPQERVLATPLPALASADIA